MNRPYARAWLQNLSVIINSALMRFWESVCRVAEPPISISY